MKYLKNFLYLKRSFLVKANKFYIIIIKKDKKIRINIRSLKEKKTISKGKIFIVEKKIMMKKVDRLKIQIQIVKNIIKKIKKE